LLEIPPTAPIRGSLFSAGGALIYRNDTAPGQSAASA
jgi:hypothetical protein